MKSKNTRKTAVIGKKENLQCDKNNINKKHLNITLKNGKRCSTLYTRAA
jgi:hypothetical protein